MMMIVIARKSRVALIHRMWRWWRRCAGTLMCSLMMCLSSSLMVFSSLVVSHIHVRQVTSRIVVIVHDTLAVLMHQMLISWCIWSAMTSRMYTSLWSSMWSLLGIVAWGK